MTNILQLATLFLAQMGFGSALILPFFPIKVTGKSFLRFYYGYIVLALALFALTLFRLDQYHSLIGITLAVPITLWLISFKKNFSRLEMSLCWGLAGLSLIALFLYPKFFVLSHISYTQYSISFLFLLSSSIFLTFHMMNMIFGHWYLINRDLPISHLIKTCKNLIWFSYLRLFTVLLATYMAYEKLDPQAFDRLIDFMGHGVFFWARILGGLGLPLMVSHMAYESAKIKSNQSATGILYAGTVFVLIGEFMGLYLFSITGIFF